MHRTYARTYLKQWESHSVDYKLTLRISDKQLPSLLANAIAAGAFVLSCDQIEFKPKTMRYVDGKRDKGISAEDFVMNFVADGLVHSIEDIGKALVTRGFSAASTSPTISKLVAKKLVLRTSDSQYVQLWRHAMETPNS